MSRTVYVLHEYGAPRHFLPHDWLAAHGPWAFIYLPPLTTVRQAIGALTRGQLKDAGERLAGVSELAVLRGLEGQTILVGVAPFSGWIFLLERLARKNRVILFTSWPRWSVGTAVHHPWNRMLAERWWAFLRRIDVVAVTAPAANGVAQCGGHAVVIPHAYDPEMFTPGGMSDDAPLRVGFAGRLVEEKGIRHLLSAATHLTSVRVSIAGAGPLESDVEACCRAHSHVEFLGYLTGTALVDVYQHSHVLVLPSLRRPGWEELFGISLIEAFACGATAIASDHVGPTSIITDRHDGLILGDVSASSILEALRLLDRDRALLGTLRAHALRTAHARYEVGVVAAKWAELLHG